eukprot:TRINITY_DN10387_c0_g1_i4.p1 TRINITY_DN10387_c0_g1~~TRINITY_DN10387_c0_g1_i4.p1  ORF type:complete len:975 (-),score=167.35 TRINITY_DN10387_c0_g1_i4:39-2963(-)
MCIRDRSQAILLQNMSQLQINDPNLEKLLRLFLTNFQSSKNQTLMQIQYKEDDKNSLTFTIKQILVLISSFLISCNNNNFFKELFLNPGKLLVRPLLKNQQQSQQYAIPFQYKYDVNKVLGYNRYACRKCGYEIFVQGCLHNLENKVVYCPNCQKNGETTIIANPSIHHTVTMIDQTQQQSEQFGAIEWNIEDLLQGNSLRSLTLQEFRIGHLIYHCILLLSTFAHDFTFEQLWQFISGEPNAQYPEQKNPIGGYIIKHIELDLLAIRQLYNNMTDQNLLFLLIEIITSINEQISKKNQSLTMIPITFEQRNQLEQEFSRIVKNVNNSLEITKQEYQKFTQLLSEKISQQQQSSQVILKQTYSEQQLMDKSFCWSHLPNQLRYQPYTNSYFSQLSTLQVKLLNKEPLPQNHQALQLYQNILNQIQDQNKKGINLEVLIFLLDQKNQQQLDYVSYILKNLVSLYQIIYRNYNKKFFSNEKDKKLIGDLVQSDPLLNKQVQDLDLVLNTAQDLLVINFGCQQQEFIEFTKEKILSMPIGAFFYSDKKSENQLNQLFNRILTLISELQNKFLDSLYDLIKQTHQQIYLNYLSMNNETQITFLPLNQINIETNIIQAATILEKEFDMNKYVMQGLDIKTASKWLSDFKSLERDLLKKYLQNKVKVILANTPSVEAKDYSTSALSQESIQQFKEKVLQVPLDQKQIEDINQNLNQIDFELLQKLFTDLCCCLSFLKQTGGNQKQNLLNALDNFRLFQKNQNVQDILNQISIQSLYSLISFIENQIMDRLVDLILYQYQSSDLTEDDKVFIDKILGETKITIDNFKIAIGKYIIRYLCSNDGRFSDNSINYPFFYEIFSEKEIWPENIEQKQLEQFSKREEFQKSVILMQSKAVYQYISQKIAERQAKLQKQKEEEHKKLILQCMKDDDNNKQENQNKSEQYNRVEVDCSAQFKKVQKSNEGQNQPKNIKNKRNQRKQLE